MSGSTFPIWAVALSPSPWLRPHHGLRIVDKILVLIHSADGIWKDTSFSTGFAARWCLAARRTVAPDRGRVVDTGSGLL
jgi:hypothetical protein